jgi:dihydrofolate synthase / folylpolyglutamate synthase
VRGINAADYLPGRELALAQSQTIPADPAAPGSAAETNVLHLPANHYSVSVAGETINVRSPLYGEHQRRNIALAIAAAVELRTKLRTEVSTHSIEQGIANTVWPGRLEFLPPNLLLDVAHNPAGAWTLRAAIASLPESQPRTLLFSCLRDKDLNEISRILFPLFDFPGGSARNQQYPHHIVFAPIANARAASLEDLSAAARALDIPAQSAATPAEALALARRLTPPGGLIIATGSIYLVGTLRELALRS